MLVVAAVVVVLGLSAAGARRVSFDADVLSLLPRDGRVIPAFRQYLSSFGSVDHLYVVFTAPATHAAITLLGYGTLLNSSYPPLRSIGIVSAVSVFTLAAASVLVLPALLLGKRG